MKNFKTIQVFQIAAVVMVSLLLSCITPKANNLVVLKKQGLPVVYYRVMISAGSAMDPNDKPGLACFTANLLNRGTTSYSRDQIESKLDQMGAQINIAVEKEVVVITGKTLAENSGEFYSIFREILTEPSFPEDQVLLMRSEQLDKINRVREDDGRLSQAVFENKVFEGHRYGHIVEGTESAVRYFNREDAKLFYHDNYLKGNIYAGIAGAVDDTLVDRFRADLDRMPTGQVVRSDVKPKEIKKRLVILVEKENRAQSHLRIGHLVDYNRQSPDFYPMRLLSCYLGEHREQFGRLFQTVRSERGLAYGAYAYSEYYRQGDGSKLMANGIPRADQYFHMWTYPKEINFEFCIKLMLSEMTKLTTAPIPEADFNRVRDYVANQFAFAMETPEKQLGMYLDQMWYNTSDFIEQFRNKINAVSYNEVQSVALDKLHPNSVLIVAVVSDGEAAKQQLISRDTKLELPSGAKEGDLATVNQQIKDMDLGLSADQIVVLKAGELFK